MAKTLTTEEWIEVLHNDSIMRPLGREILKTLYTFPNERASAKELGEVMQEPWQNINLEIGDRIGRRIAEQYELELTSRENKKYKFWDIFFDGTQDGELFDWIMRPALASALVAVGAVPVNHALNIKNWDKGGNNYIKKAGASNKWTGFQQSVIEKLILTFGEDFNIVIYSDPKKQDDYYCIPFKVIKHLFIGEHKATGKFPNRWTAIILNHNFLMHSNSQLAVDISAYYAKPLFFDDFSLPGLPTEIGGKEGGTRTITVTVVERNPANRNACIAHWGDSCIVCGFNFGKKYGNKAEGYIHVHHHNLLASSGEVVTDPINEMSPLCPNCHAVAHLKRPPYSIDELKAMTKDTEEQSS